MRWWLLAWLAVAAPARALEPEDVERALAGRTDAAAVAEWWPRLSREFCGLAARPSGDAAREAWIELERAESALYPALNAWGANAAAPAAFGNDHDIAALRWGRVMRAVPTVILHVDSHPDLGPLPAAARTAPDLAPLVTDVNQPLAVTVLGTGAPEIVWWRPPWAVLGGVERLPLLLALPRDPERPLPPARGCVRECLGFFVDATALDAAARARLDAAAAALGPRADEVRLALTRPGEAFDVVRKVSFRIVAPGADPAMGPKRFVLSLDLDAFATNGVPGSPGDPCSPGRVSPKCAGVPATPAGRARAWAAERAALDARLADFARLLAALRREGATPVGLYLADSTFLPVSACAECRSSQDFTPPEWVAYVRHRALDALAAAFPEAGWGALASGCAGQ